MEKDKEEPVVGKLMEFANPNRVTLRIFVVKNSKKFLKSGLKVLNPKDLKNVPSRREVPNYTQSVISDNGSVPAVGDELLWEIETLSHLITCSAMYRVIKVVRPFIRRRITEDNPVPTAIMEPEIDVYVVELWRSQKVTGTGR